MLGQRMNVLARKPVDEVAAGLVWPCGTPPVDDFAGKRADVEIRIAQRDAQRMNAVVAAVHKAVATPLFQEAALADAPAIARAAPQRVLSLFSGFDFHLTDDGPKLIEINTNAGGAFYGALIDDARWREGDAEARPLGYWSHLFVQHVRREWQSAGRGVLRVVAIVDDAPDAQFLRLEFHLAARMLNEAGIVAFIADPRELSTRDGRLWRGAMPIDLVYNRLTSFALDRDADSALHTALLEGAAVVSPDPRAHALLACKRNLARLSDDAFLRDAGVDSRMIDVLIRSIPKTLSVRAENADAIWQDRARYYFKPRSGFGSRAVYDGAKLTAKTWGDITSRADYLAQARADASRVELADGQAMRFDVRSFAFGRETFMRLARVYRGQTTNFRTPGGGFATVRVSD